MRFFARFLFRAASTSFNFFCRRLRFFSDLVDLVDEDDDEDELEEEDDDLGGRFFLSLLLLFEFLELGLRSVYVFAFSSNRFVLL